MILCRFRKGEDETWTRYCTQTGWTNTKYDSYRKSLPRACGGLWGGFAKAFERSSGIHAEHLRLKERVLVEKYESAQQDGGPPQPPTRWKHKWAQPWVCLGQISVGVDWRRGPGPKRRKMTRVQDGHEGFRDHRHDERETLSRTQAKILETISKTRSMKNQGRWARMTQQSR